MPKRRKKPVVSPLGMLLKSVVSPPDLDRLHEQLTNEIISSIALYWPREERGLCDDEIEALEEILQFHPELADLFQLRREVAMLQARMADGAR